LAVDAVRRVAIAERSNWRARAAEAGFRFHTIDGAPYWDETAYYAFTLRQIENDLEDPSAELHAMALDLVGDVVASEELMERLAIPAPFRDWIAESWRRRDPQPGAVNRGPRRPGPEPAKQARAVVCPCVSV